MKKSPYGNHLWLTRDKYLVSHGRLHMAPMSDPTWQLRHPCRNFFFFPLFCNTWIVSHCTLFLSHILVVFCWFPADGQACYRLQCVWWATKLWQVDGRAFSSILSYWGNQGCSFCFLKLFFSMHFWYISYGCFGFFVLTHVTLISLVFATFMFFVLRRGHMSSI